MNDIRNNILKIIELQAMSPAAISIELKVHRVSVHRELKKLHAEGLVHKMGQTPHVLYRVSRSAVDSRIEESYGFFKGIYNERDDLTQQTIDQIRTRASSASGEAVDFDYYLDVASVYSSNIEGNTQDVSAYMNSKGQPKSLKTKEQIEIEELKEAYVKAMDLKLNESNLLKMHKVFSRSFVSTSRRGVYRQEPVGVFSARGVEYMAIEPFLIKAEVRVLFSIIEDLMINSPAKQAAFWGSWIHLMFVLVHPFADGNGRAARLLEKWFLSEKLGQGAWLLSTEEGYYLKRAEYYQNLKVGVNYWEVDFGQSAEFISMLKYMIEKEG